MKKNESLLRISFWIGAVFDGLMVFPMLIPSIAGVMFGIDGFNPGNDYRFAMQIASSLMIGWTMLLIWADRKPKERAAILLLTVFPVVSCLFISGIYAVYSGFITFGNMLPTWIMQVLMSVFFIFSYIKNR